MIAVSRDELTELHDKAQDVALRNSLAAGAVRYLARASEEIVTRDLSCVLELIGCALASYEEADQLHDRLDALRKREDIQ